MVGSPADAPAFTLLPRREPPGSGFVTPGPSLILDDSEKQRSVVNSDRTLIRFGIKPKLWSKPPVETPGVDYVPSSTIGARPVSFGVRHRCRPMQGLWMVFLV